MALLLQLQQYAILTACVMLMVRVISSRIPWLSTNDTLIHPGFEGMDAIEEPRWFAPTVIDWTHETTRTACHLITTGVTRQFPDVKIILSPALL